MIATNMHLPSVFIGWAVSALTSNFKLTNSAVAVIVLGILGIVELATSWQCGESCGLCVCEPHSWTCLAPGFRIVCWAKCQIQNNLLLLRTVPVRLAVWTTRVPSC